MYKKVTNNAFILIRKKHKEIVFATIHSIFTFIPFNWHKNLELNIDK